MADEVTPQWFRKSNGEEFSVNPGEPILYNRLANSGEYVAIDGPEGDEMDLPSPDEEAAAEGAAESETTPPLENYDDLTIEELLPQLEDLDDEQLAAVEAYEVANKNRTTLLEAIAEMRTSEEGDEG
jgi:hypothetical protein